MATALGYTVTSQRRTESLSPAGHFEPVVQVTIVTDSGTPATFDFNDTQYTAETVGATIGEWIARHDAVANLGK